VIASTRSTPEDERDTSYDPDEEYPWDCDLNAPCDADVQDLLSDEDDE
jgi:hypothetical protein